MDVINGVPFAARLVRRRGLAVLVHHVHREQWALIYPGLGGRVGWALESRLTPRLYRDVPVITVSAATRDDLVELGYSPATITIVGNGVQLPATHTPRSPEPRLCVLARLVPHKQVEDALATVAALAVPFPALYLDVVGDGLWRDELAARAAELGVADRVTFHGRVSAADRDRLLAASWVLLLPSVKEGWGLAVSEAAAAGTPAIAYRSAGGTRESVVDGVTGLLAEDREEFVRLTARVLGDATLREQLGAAARERAATLDWNRSAAQFREVLVVVSDRRSGRPGRWPGCSKGPR